MRKSSHLYIILILLLAMPNGVVLACGTSKEKSKKTEKGIFSSTEGQSEKMTCCPSDDRPSNDHHGCDGNCDHKACHCLVSVNIPLVLEKSKFSLENNYNILDHNWAYFHHIPKTVYLSIWQPPKIG